MGKPPLKIHLSFKSKEPNVEVKFLYSQVKVRTGFNDCSMEIVIICK